MEYNAHKNGEKTQPLKDHLENTANLARDYAVDMFKDIVYPAGKLHDIGKYCISFQKRLNGSNDTCEHSICGAKYIDENFNDNVDIFAPLLKFCIAGHHSGLPDGGDKVDNESSATLCGRLKRKTEDYSAFKNEIDFLMPDTEELNKYLFKSGSVSELLERYAFMTKYVFSCLTDADFIDTERFCNPEAKRGLDGNFEVALEKLNKKLAQFTADTKVKQARKNLLEQAVKNSENMQDINILNMPTGSGKTLCSLKIALERAIVENKKRIIYVIPYTSIIEQTANVFNDIFGDDLYVLQHHSNFNYEGDKGADDKLEEQNDTSVRLKKTCENWDAPLIVTTSVQFFQSLYHYKGSRLRKLHNLADSIIIFDEIHLIPENLLQPCLRGVGYITSLLNSKAIFLSATMPNYTPFFEKYMPNNKIYNLIEDKSDFEKFQNCTYENLGDTNFENVVMKANDFQSSLIIVNKRKSARDVYEMLEGNKFHLSTYMTPAHRSKTIAKIKDCLSKGEKIVVVSTSLVEAGVDFDFEVVFRELAGLDSILQAGGRCNREGKRENGKVFIFKTAEDSNNQLKTKANIANAILKEKDISSQESIEEFYDSFFKFKESVIDNNSIATFSKKVTRPKYLPFREYAMNFEYIKSDTIAIVINNCKETEDIFSSPDFGNMSSKRKLMPYSISVYNYEFDELVKLGLLEKLPCGIFVLSSNDNYREDIGLSKELKTCMV